MNQYEVMYVIDTALEEQARSELINRFSNLVAQNGGTVDRVDEWGKRRLAYAINYKTEGYYVLMYITAPADLPRELERNFRIADAVLRSLVIRFEGPIPAKREPLKPFVAREAAPRGRGARRSRCRSRRRGCQLPRKPLPRKLIPKPPRLKSSNNQAGTESRCLL